MTSYFLSCSQECTVHWNWKTVLASRKHEKYYLFLLNLHKKYIFFCACTTSTHFYPCNWCNINLFFKSIIVQVGNRNFKNKQIWFYFHIFTWLHYILCIFIVTCDILGPVENKYIVCTWKIFSCRGMRVTAGHTGSLRGTIEMRIHQESVPCQYVFTAWNVSVFFEL